MAEAVIFMQFDADRPAPVELESDLSTLSEVMAVSVEAEEQERGVVEVLSSVTVTLSLAGGMFRAAGGTAEDASDFMNKIKGALETYKGLRKAWVELQTADGPVTVELVGDDI